MKRRHEDHDDNPIRAQNRLREERTFGDGGPADPLEDRDYGHDAARSDVRAADLDHPTDRMAGRDGMSATADDRIPGDRMSEDRWDDARYVDDGRPTRRVQADDGHTATAGLTPLFRDTQAEALRTRWQEVQTSFVDAPREAVQQADALVAQAVDHLTDLFRRQRDELEQQWARGEDVSTEDLRQTLQRYRSFFDRLLAL